MKASNSTPATFEIFGSKGQVIAILKVKSYIELVAKKKRVTKMNADNVVTVLDVQPKWKYTPNCQEELHPTVYNAEVNLTTKSIRIFGQVKRSKTVEVINTEGKLVKEYITYAESFNLTFSIGDDCVTGSYNLIYTDKITNIAKGSVFADGKRFDLYTFIMRNWNFDAKRIADENADTRMYI